MNKPTFITSKDLTQYDSHAYTAFMMKLRKKEADWNEFLPSTAAFDIGSIVFKYKLAGAENFDVKYIGNPYLYTLKNEFNSGYCYGFAITDLFSTFLEIADKFFKDDQLRVYKQNISTLEEIKVIEFTEQVSGDLQEFVKTLKAIGSKFSRTEEIIKNWNVVLEGRNLQDLMHRFSLYTNALLEEEIKTNKISDTPYHWYRQLKNSNTYSEVAESLAVYNINFEKLIAGFEQFFIALNRQKGLRGTGLNNKIDRPIYID